MAGEKHHFFVDSTETPRIEVDTLAGAVYVQFKKATVAKTIDQSGKRLQVTIDLDKEGKVIGIETIGAGDISLKAILELANVKAPKIDLSDYKLVTNKPAFA